MSASDGLSVGCGSTSCTKLVGMPPANAAVVVHGWWALAKRKRPLGEGTREEGLPKVGDVCLACLVVCFAYLVV